MPVSDGRSQPRIGQPLLAPNGATDNSPGQGAAAGLGYYLARALPCTIDLDERANRLIDGPSAKTATSVAVDRTRRTCQSS
jgi:hypothetical protein